MNDNMYIMPVENSLRIMEKMYPTEQTPTKFDKIIELIKTISSNSKYGVIECAIETAGKVCSRFICEKQRTKAVKYVADAYEAKLCAEAELSRLNNENQRIKAVTLYIEKSFQERMDNLNKEIILRCKEIDFKHLETMKQINLEHEQEITRMNLIAKEHLHSIDKRYSEMILRNENYCFLYRQYLNDLKENKITPGLMIRELSNRYMDILEVLANNPTISIERMNEALSSAKQLIEFFDKPDRYFISFDKFINKKTMIEDWSDGKI